MLHDFFMISIEQGNVHFSTIEFDWKLNNHIPIPTLEEVQGAIKQLKNNKSPGCDGIPAELIKYGGIALAREIYRLILIIWDEERMPSMWELADMTTIHKKGSKLECANYRGISLLCTLYKVYTRILLNRLQPLAENILGEQQAGFRRGRATTDQITDILYRLTFRHLGELLIC